MISDSLPKTKEIAEEFLNTLEKGSKALVIGLRGNLGSGKTTFVKAVAEILGLKQTVSSPTFVIEKIYKLGPTPTRHTKNFPFSHLVHIDAYRLKDGSELATLGFEEVVDSPDNLIFIEWPENVADILPEDVKYIDFKFIDENTREITW